MPIHPTALVAPTAQLHETVEVGPYCIIEDHVRIGAGTVIGPHSTICSHVEMGENNILHMNTVIGNNPQHKAYDGSPTITRIGNNNEFREFFTINRPFEKEGLTVLGDGCYFMTCSHVGHDCRVGNRVVLVNGALLAGHVEVMDGVNISGNAGIHQFCRIGRLAMIQGMSAITADVPPFVMTQCGLNRPVGINVIGMRRAGMGAKSRQAIKQVYKTFFREGHSVARAIELLEKKDLCEEAREMVDFVKNAKRGIIQNRD